MVRAVQNQRAPAALQGRVAFRAVTMGCFARARVAQASDEHPGSPNSPLRSLPDVPALNLIRRLADKRVEGLVREARRGNRRPGRRAVREPTGRSPTRRRALPAVRGSAGSSRCPRQRSSRRRCDRRRCGTAARATATSGRRDRGPRVPMAAPTRSTLSMIAPMPSTASENLMCSIDRPTSVGSEVERLLRRRRQPADPEIAPDRDHRQRPRC